jgi:quercetin dioxygenase-like cupin family protein
MGDEATSDERVLGPVGSKVLFENDRVRVWEMRLAPGEESAIHRHELDYLLVQVTGDRVAAVPEPDTEGPFDEYLEADLVPGAAVFIPRGGVETARNVGTQPFHEIIIELKD